jgi:hypothetical protein
VALIPGTRLGPYEIVSLVGSGGMGEVYRARDTRLDRTVAIKVLAPQLAAEPDWRARFEREARAVSSLNDPHICALYDVGHQNGVEYLVLEFVEGETLAARLARGPLPLEQALGYGIEVCEALEQAHRRGLTHRDLKPGNVMLTAAGTKLLDFGLAKPSTPALKAAGGPPTPLSTPLTTPLTSLTGLTGAGTILGTIEYMAPEQVEGRSADARTDIWALGCLLYEMICGARAFEGTTPASVLGAILEREPAPLGPLVTGESGRLWDVVRTCLEKNPDDRWQSARDLARELRWCARQPAGAQPAAPPAFVSRRAALAAGAVALTFVVALPAFWMARSAPQAVAAGPPVIVLMDSTHPERIYDEQTRKAGGTNADDLTDLLRDLPVRLVKENTNATWHREYEVLQESPALIVAHRSCFYDATMLGDASRQRPFIDLSWDKFELFAGFVAVGNPRTKILAYSRGSWSDDAASVQWVTSMEQRFPPLHGRLGAMKVPLDRATFRNKVTGSELRAHVVAMLGLGAGRRP